MAGENVARILRARSNFTAEQIEAISDTDGWKWIYEQDRAKTKVQAIEICFTGFQDIEKIQLEKQATARGLKVRTKVTQNLTYLCAGSNAGPSKVTQARELGVTFLTLDQFQTMCETGEVPLG